MSEQPEILRRSKTQSDARASSREPSPSRAAGASGPSQTPSLPPDAAIEDYLDHACAPLLGGVPYAQRQELRSEWRAHLEGLIEAYQELGSTPDEALAAALRQFGNPRALGRQWRYAWDESGGATGWASTRSSMLAALLYFGLSAAASLAIFTTAHDPFGANALAGVMCLVAIPLSAGLLSGWQAPRRSALGTFYGLSGLLIATGVWNGLLGGWEPATMLTWFGLFLWLPIGCAAAALGGWLRDRSPSAPVLAGAAAERSRRHLDGE